MATKTKTKTTTPKRRGFPPAEDGLDRMMSFRVATEDYERIAALGEALGQKPQALTRTALRIGLAVLERTPGAFVGPDAKRRPPRATTEGA